MEEAERTGRESYTGTDFSELRRAEGECGLETDGDGGTLGAAVS